MAYVVTMAAGLLLAFLAGHLTFKVKHRWCGVCGTVKCCPRCAAWAGSGVPQGLSATAAPDERSRTPGSARGRAADEQEG
jgi:hypothetical protein